MTDEDQTQETSGGVFVIDGEDYPFVSLGEGFNFDEAMVFFEYTGFPIEDLLLDAAELDGEELEAYHMKLRNPKTVAALMHLTYQRAHPHAKASNVKKIVKATDWATALSKLGDEEEDSPPAEPQKIEPPTSSSEEKPSLSLASSGNGSTTSSEPQADDPSPTGTIESDTSPISDPVISTT